MLTDPTVEGDAIRFHVDWGSGPRVAQVPIAEVRAHAGRDLDPREAAVFVSENATTYEEAARYYDQAYQLQARDLIRVEHARPTESERG